MKEFRTVCSVIIMLLAAFVGLFVGMALDGWLNCSILFVLISGIACIIYTIDNRDN